MKSVKEILELAKEHHRLWNPDAENWFMCHAVMDLDWEGIISQGEKTLVEDHIGVMLDKLWYEQRGPIPRGWTVAAALGCLSDDEKVKDFWENHINSLED